MLPFVINVWGCHPLDLRKQVDGKPIVVHEKSLLRKSLMTHLRLEFKGDQYGDPDFPQRKYIATINNKIYENIPQITLVLIETF